MIKKEKIERVFTALAGNAKKIVSKSIDGEAIFFMGNTKIVLTEKSLAIGDRLWKLPSKKKEK